MMFSRDLARIRVHRSNIHRYRRLLRTKLTELERQFIERRLVEEQAALKMLSTDVFPTDFSIAFTRPQRQPASATLGAER